MKTLFVMADGRALEGEPQAAQWLEHGGAYFCATEAYNRERPYRGCLVYVEVPKDVYDARKLDTTKDILARWRRKKRAA